MHPMTMRQQSAETSAWRSQNNPSHQLVLVHNRSGLYSFRCPVIWRGISGTSCHREHIFLFLMAHFRAGMPSRICFSVSDGTFSAGLAIVNSRFFSGWQIFGCACHRKLTFLFRMVNFRPAVPSQFRIVILDGRENFPVEFKPGGIIVMYERGQLRKFPG